MYTSPLKKTTPAANRAAELRKKNARTLPAVPVLQNKPVQKMEVEEEETLQGKFVVQRQTDSTLLAEDELEDGATQLKSAEEEELPLQGKFTVQKKELEEELPLQGKFISAETAQDQQSTVQRFNPKTTSIQKKENNTGLPDNLKEGVENLSGFAMDDVNVHYHSDKPAQLNALAYAQGTDIHVGPGQEEHLPHEAWHVVQQKQGRVQPTMQMKEGVPVNDDSGLENEADVMGAKALSAVTQVKEEPILRQTTKGVIQRFNAGIGAGWHIHFGEHIKYASNNATRVNFTGRTRRQVGYSLEQVIQENGLTATKGNADFIACKAWIRNNIA